MKGKTFRQCLAILFVLATYSLASSAVRSQDRKAPPPFDVMPIVKGDCPRPVATTLAATTPNVVNADFSAQQLAGPRAWLNDPAINKSFLYTFAIPTSGRCCEITRAVLTITMKSNQGGGSNTSADAGNDGVAIMHLGATVPPFAQSVYSNWGFGVGQPSVKTWTLNPAVLNNINAFHRLSIYVQDDTRVESVTLQVSGCCLGSAGRDSVEQSLSSELAKPSP